MKSLIITVAGTANRFNRDTKEKVLKCLYYEDTPDNALLSIQIHKAFALVDEIIVVGGYKYDDLEHFINKNLTDVKSRIKLLSAVTFSFTDLENTAKRVVFADCSLISWSRISRPYSLAVSAEAIAATLLSPLSLTALAALAVLAYSTISHPCPRIYPAH